MKPFQISVLLQYILLHKLAYNFANTTHVHGKSRQRRLITFPEGSSFLQLVVGVGLPFAIGKQSVTTGPFVKGLYRFPTNSSVYTNPSIEINNERKRRAASTRWNLYSSLSATAKHLGYGGKACVLRTICEIAETPFSEKGDIFTEIFHVIFTPSSTLESVDNHLDYEYLAAEHLGRTTKNCERLFPECIVNPIEKFTEIMSEL